MSELPIFIILASIIANAAPIVTAAVGETITEKAGVINLSLDGTILLSAMVAFAVSYDTGNVIYGFIAAALVGGAVALVIAVFSIYIGAHQVAVGFILTLTTRDLAYFLGNPYSRLHGPQVSPMGIPFLKNIPFLGPVLFNHNLPVYFSILLIGFVFWYMYRTSYGLTLRAVGEHPAAAYARGIHPRRVQLFYTVIGGMLVGLGGAMFSLLVKPGWGRPQGAEGTGWIALALVIFGGWNPLKVAMGAYLFSFLQIMGLFFQKWIPFLPTQVIQVAPFPLMIFTLLIMEYAKRTSEKRMEQAAFERETGVKKGQERSGGRGKNVWAPILNFISASQPASLGKPYKPE